jgi:hypothetical protein
VHTIAPVRDEENDQARQQKDTRLRVVDALAEERNAFFYLVLSLYIHPSF